MILPSGRIPIKAAKVYAAILFIVGIALALIVGIWPAIIAAIAALLLFAYATKLKKIALVGNIAVSLLVALTFIYGGLINLNLVPLMPLAVLAFLSNMGREIFKTAEDISGDRKQGAKTIAVNWGVLVAKRLASVFVILSIALSIVPFVFGILGLPYLSIVIVADIMFIVSILSPVRRAAKLTKLAMFVSLVAFLVGGIYR